MTTEATEKDRPEKPAPEPVEETGPIYSDQPGAGPPGSPNAPAEEGAATAPETPASAPEATETPVEKGTAKKGA